MMSRWMLVVSLLLVSGCVHRTLTIQTEPPGAWVYVNDEFKGASPVTYDFLWYGWHRVRIEQEGYAQVVDRKLLRAPAHLWIPFDLVLELMPVTVRDERTWRYVLTRPQGLPTPIPPPDIHSTPEGTDATR